MKFIFPIILVALSVGLFIKYINPTYHSISGLQTTKAAYNEALNNSQEFVKKRDELASKYANLSQTDRDRLQKLMPDNVDNIRLIIDIQKIASQYGMLPRDISFDPVASNGQPTGQQLSPSQLQEANKDYGTFALSFSVNGTYGNFLGFLGDLEKSLRIVDIQSITFSADATGTTYKYNFKVQTYWLKN